MRQFPGQKNFRIQDSDAFLSVSLSLSFGVMVRESTTDPPKEYLLTHSQLFSALYKMLPSSRDSLEDAGFSPKEATWILLACFLGGAVGIQILSRLMHSFMKHEVIDCGHTHEDEEAAKKHAHHGHDDVEDQDDPRRTRSRVRSHARPSQSQKAPSMRKLVTQKSASRLGQGSMVVDSDQEGQTSTSMKEVGPTLQQRLTASLSSLTTSKDPTCTLDEPCYGFSGVCGPDCFQKVNLRSGSRAPEEGERLLERPKVAATESTPLLQNVTTFSDARPRSSNGAEAGVHGSMNGSTFGLDGSSGAILERRPLSKHSHRSEEEDTESEHEHAEHHHHHIPANAFLSIGLQTSFAIALHKLPEGFITYATNHANPQLGVSVFLALFIHNITEGFALALPLYLAINNRMKAMGISFVLGGLSQPLGAGIAALWFKLAGQSKWAPSDGVYGGMFAVTAGIMASVALQLFSESLDLTHSKNLCMTGAFVGMAMLGASSALTA